MIFSARDHPPLNPFSNEIANCTRTCKKRRGCAKLRPQRLCVFRYGFKIWQVRASTVTKARSRDPRGASSPHRPSPHFHRRTDSFLSFFPDAKPHTLLDLHLSLFLSLSLSLVCFGIPRAAAAFAVLVRKKDPGLSGIIMVIIISRFGFWDADARSTLFSNGKYGSNLRATSPA